MFVGVSSFLSPETVSLAREKCGAVRSNKISSDTIRENNNATNNFNGALEQLR